MKMTECKKMEENNEFFIVATLFSPLKQPIELILMSFNFQS